MKLFFAQIKKALFNPLLIKEKYKLIPYIIALLVFIYAITKLIYEIVFLK